MNKLLLGAFVAMLAAAAQKGSRAELQLEAAVNREVVAGDLKGAVELYRKAAQSSDRSVAARALVRMGQCYEKLGDAEARKAYERAVRDYSDQAEAAATARARLAALGEPGGGAAGMVARQIARIGDKRFLGGISRDGRYTAFTLPGGVFLFDLKTGEERRLVQRIGEQSFNGAVISPDGKQVAYAKLSADSGTFVQLVGVDGSEPRQLEVGGEGTGFPKGWTRDGRQLLVARWRKNDTPERVLVSPSSGAQTVIGTGGIAGRASFSPDGSVAAISEYQGDSKPYTIALLPLGGGKPETIADGWNPAWTPDGKRLVFTREQDGRSDLWSLRIENGKALGTPDFVQPGVDTLLDVGPEGDCFYRTTLLVRNLFTAAIDPQTGKLAGAPVQVTSRDTSAGAAWSPNGELLAYYKWQNGSAGLKFMVRSSKTGEDREVPLKETISPYSRKPQWFPDNRSLFVHSWDAKLRRLDIETGELRPLLAGVTIPPYTMVGNTGYQTLEVLSPDGRSVYYLVRGPEPNRSRIVKRDLDGGPEQAIARIDSDNVRGLAISPDGSQLAVHYVGPSGAVFVTLPSAGGELKQVYAAATGPGRFPHDVMWSRDGRRLFFLRGFGTGHVLSIPAEGGEPQELGIQLHDLYYLNLHPDGKQIIFADEQWNNHLWVANKLFPPAKGAR